MNSGANLLRISRVGHLAPIHLPQLEHQELVSRKRLHLRSAMVRREHPSPVDPYDHRIITRRILQPTRCSVARREKHDDDEPRKRRSHISPWLAGTCTEAATSVEFPCSSLTRYGGVYVRDALALRSARSQMRPSRGTSTSGSVCR